MGCGAAKVDPHDEVLPLEEPAQIVPPQILEKQDESYSSEYYYEEESEVSSESSTVSIIQVEEHPTLVDVSFPAPKARECRIKFQLGIIIGEGTFGKVYSAIERVNGFPMAVKELKTEGMNEKQLQEVETEIKFMANLQHEHVVQIYDSFRQNDKIWIVMEYLPYGSLQSLTKQFKGIPEILAKRLVKDLVSALAYLHQNHCAHLDLKCANAMLGAQQQLKLVDFGTSIHTETAVVAAGIRGSPYWLAPECVKSPVYDVFKADVWALGALLIELIDSTPPFFQIKQAPAVMYHVSQLTKPPELNSPSSADCQDFLKKCLQIQPDQRATMAQLLQHPWLQIEKVCQLTELLPNELALRESTIESYKEQDLLGLKDSISQSQKKAQPFAFKTKQLAPVSQLDWTFADTDFNALHTRHNEELLSLLF